MIKAPWSVIALVVVLAIAAFVMILMLIWRAAAHASVHGLPPEGFFVVGLLVLGLAGLVVGVPGWVREQAELHANDDLLHQGVPP